jgi:hypothetical protein
MMTGMQSLLQAIQLQDIETDYLSQSHQNNSQHRPEADIPEIMALLQRIAQSLPPPFLFFLSASQLFPNTFTPF